MAAQSKRMTRSWFKVAFIFIRAAVGGQSLVGRGRSSAGTPGRRARPGRALWASVQKQGTRAAHGHVRGAGPRSRIQRLSTAWLTTPKAHALFVFWLFFSFSIFI